MAISDSSRDCIRKALEVLDIGEEEGGRPDAEAFQLWAKTKLDEAPYPLIGKQSEYWPLLEKVGNLLKIKFFLGPLKFFKTINSTYFLVNFVCSSTLKRNFFGEDLTLILWC